MVQINFFHNSFNIVDARQRNERNARMGAAERYGFASELFLDQLILLES
jgi:hypothetical protein